MNENTQENTSKSILPRWWRKLPLQQKLLWPAMPVSVVVVIALLVALHPFFGAAPAHIAPPPGYFDPITNISSGEFLINNQRYSFNGKSSTQFLTFPAQNGKNTIQLIAPPFQPITCIVQLPKYTVLTPSSCTIIGVGMDSNNEKTGGVSIFETLQNLPNAMQAQAIHAIEAAPIGTNAVWSETAPAGSHILENGKVQAIQSPWLVTMSRQVNLKVLTFPQITDSTDKFGNNLWFANIGISDIWTYTSLDTKQMYQNIVEGGSVVVSINYTPTAIRGASISFFEGGSSPLSSPLADFEGWPYACAELSTLWPSELPNIRQSIIYTKAESGIYGCLFWIDFVSNASSAINTTKIKPQFLIKFGVFLAANAEAHILFPQLPQASALEVQEAIQNNQCQLTPDGC